MAHPSLLYDEMSGMENLRYFARLYGIAGDERCREAIRAVGLDPELTRGVGQYSQGYAAENVAGAGDLAGSGDSVAR